MKNLFVRTLSGTVFLVIMVGAILSGIYVFMLLALLLNIIGLYEFTNLKPETFKNPFSSFLFIFSGVLVYAIITLISSNVIAHYSILWSLIIIVPFLIYISIKQKKAPVRSGLNFLSGLIYVPVPFALLSTFYFKNNLGIEDHELLLGFFMILWSNDVFAYLVGSSMGRTKLNPRLSPKKTWEGTVGGVVLSILAAYIISRYFFSLNTLNWLALGLLISIFATLGDLLESKLKRQADVKDSGKIMPGHGGVLDRFDGMILAAPAVYIYLSIVS